MPQTGSMAPCAAGALPCCKCWSIGARADWQLIYVSASPRLPAVKPVVARDQPWSHDPQHKASQRCANTAEMIDRAVAAGSALRSRRACAAFLFVGAQRADRIVRYFSQTLAKH